MNLYQLEESFRNLEEVLENTEDQDLKNLINTSMEQLEIDVNTKIENIIKFIRNLESNLVAYDTEIKRLQAAKKTDSNKIESLKSYLLSYMELKDLSKLTTSLFKVSTRKSESVNITDLNSIPRAYIRVKEEVDKTLIKQALKDGEVIEGAEIIENKSINIK